MDSEKHAEDMMAKSAETLSPRPSLQQESSAGRCSKDTAGEIARAHGAEPPAEGSIDNGDEGRIRLYKFHERLTRKNANSMRQKRRRRLCQQLGLAAKSKRQSNFLNLTKEEMQDIKTHNEILAFKKEARFRNMFSSYITGIIGDEGIMKEMNELVAKHDHMRANKRLSLYQCWHEQVFKHINEQVQNKLTLLSKAHIKDKLRYFHYQYMNASNRRLLFLDVLDNSLYDPFESLRYSIKYITNFSDPLKHNMDKAKFEAFVMGNQIPKAVKTRKILDASLWNYSKFRSTLWGHLNADEEDGSETVVKHLEKWHSHDVLYNIKNHDSELQKEISRGGKYIVPNQGKGWSFRKRHEGKGKVTGLPCMTQPKLQLCHN